MSSIGDEDATADELILNKNLTPYYGPEYKFTPNQVSQSIDLDGDITYEDVSVYLYASGAKYRGQYGDVDYPFVLKPYDIVIINDIDGSFEEFRVIQVYIDNTNRLRIKMDRPFSKKTRLSLKYSQTTNESATLDSVLFLTRQKDETNTYVIYNKRQGQTSYGFLISDTLSSDVLGNIDTITKQVKQKLLADQQGQIGGGEE
jgi:hypothetical protein